LLTMLSRWQQAGSPEEVNCYDFMTAPMRQ
jgi:hypothetical protein